MAPVAPPPTPAPALSQGPPFFLSFAAIRRGLNERGRHVGGVLAPLVAYAAIVQLAPRPASMDDAGWKTTAVFVAVVVGLMLRPLPGGAIVLLGLAATAMVSHGGTAAVLAGFASPSVWMILLAMMIARAVRQTGLARRVALLFVRQFGHSALGTSYALLLSDVVLATSVPSNTARCAGVILPVTEAIAELHESRPGPTAERLGAFLMLVVYQGGVIVCAMFLTGQAANFLIVDLAAQLAGVSVTWTRWLIAGVVPGLLSCALVPFVIYRMAPPELKQTPDAAAHARRQLLDMGSMATAEWTCLTILAGVVLMWTLPSQLGVDPTLAALLGASALLVTGVFRWQDVLKEETMWDVFVWYGGLVTMGQMLSQNGAPTVLAESVTRVVAGWPQGLVVSASVLAFFYAHYAMASITTHIVALYPPFVLLLLAQGVPASLAVYLCACLVNLTAGLTHYGTTTAPIVFGCGYVTQARWLATGAVVSVVNIAVWTIVGVAWWKVIGYW